MEYDKLYRLKAVNLVNTPPTAATPIEAFTYDKTGNRLSKTLGTAAALTYTYPGSNHRLTNAGTGARSFDANGNTTQIPGTGSLSYDERNRLTTVVDSATRTAEYNARGERVRSVLGASCASSGSDNIFIYSESGALLGNADLCASGSEDVIYLDSTPIARVKGGVVSPLEADHLGSPRVMQKPNGTGADWSWDLLANSATGSNAFGEQAPAGSETFNLRFPGQYSDGDGLTYNYFRDYEPSTGRYVESDPIGLKGGVGTYAYSNGNSLIYIDPEGLSPFCSAPICFPSFWNEKMLSKTLIGITPWRLKNVHSEPGAPPPVGRLPLPTMMGQVTATCYFWRVRNYKSLFERSRNWSCAQVCKTCDGFDFKTTSYVETQQYEKISNESELKTLGLNSYTPELDCLKRLNGL